jgi:alpha/beta superfamily hydrolase
LSLRERAVVVESGGLRLEGMLHDGDGRLAAVMLHPHPQYGGDMDNHVVTAVCGALAAHGATTLRFNFRGTGRSEGRFDSGNGERDDARAAVAALREAAPNARLVVAGYSFGALIAAGIAGEYELAELILVSPPVAFAPLPALPDAPTLLITGEFDDVAPAKALAGLAGLRRQLAVVPGAGHAWWPGADALSAELLAVAADLTG